MNLADAEGERLRMGELADRLLLSRSGITRLADRLERQGLIARERCTDDGRGYFAHLTEAGRELVEAARPAPPRRRPPPLPRPSDARGDRRPRRDLAAPARPIASGRLGRSGLNHGRYPQPRCPSRPRSAIDRASASPSSPSARWRSSPSARRSPSSATSAGVKVMPGGVPSSFQMNEPWPVYLERGQGSRVWDVDGHEYVDFHNGFGVMAVGHANPTIGAAVKARIDLGTHFAAPTDGSIVGRRGARRPLRPAAVAVHQLRHRVDDGRGPPRARRHRPRPDPEDRGLLPRPPRLGDGRASTRRSRRSAIATTRARCPTAPATRWRSPSSPARSRSTTPTRSRACSASSTARSPA